MIYRKKWYMLDVFVFTSGCLVINMELFNLQIVLPSLIDYLFYYERITCKQGYNIGFLVYHIIFVCHSCNISSLVSIQSYPNLLLGWIHVYSVCFFSIQLRMIHYLFSVGCIKIPQCSQ